MHLQIITPSDTLYEGEVKLVQLPGIDGSFEILQNHAPLVSGLKKGKIRIIDNANYTHFFNIKGGVVEVLDNKISILAE